MAYRVFFSGTAGASYTVAIRRSDWTYYDWSVAGPTYGAFSGTPTQLKSAAMTESSTIPGDFSLILGGTFAAPTNLPSGGTQFSDGPYTSVVYDANGIVAGLADKYLIGGDDNVSPSGTGITTSQAQTACAAALTAQGYTTGRSVKLDFLDTNVASRLASTSYGDTSGVTTLVGLLTPTRATKLDNLDATVSSRSTYAGADTAGTTTLLTRLSGTRATNLDFLDASVASRLPTTSYAAPPSAAAIDAQLGTSHGSGTWGGGSGGGLTTTDIANVLTAQGLTTVRSAKLDNLDAAVSSRLPTTSYAAAPSAAAIDAQLGSSHGSGTWGGGTGGGITTTDIANVLTAQGLTTARAGRLDNLDATVSGVGAAVSGVNAAVGGVGTAVAAASANVIAVGTAVAAIPAAPTVASIVAGVYREAAGSANLTQAGSIGLLLASQPFGGATSSYTGPSPAQIAAAVAALAIEPASGIAPTYTLGQVLAILLAGLGSIQSNPTGQDVFQSPAGATRLTATYTTSGRVVVFSPPGA